MSTYKNPCRALPLGQRRLLALCLACLMLIGHILPQRLSASPASDQPHYLVEGIIYAEGYEDENGATARITHLQLIDAVKRIERRSGQSYALVAYDDEYDAISITSVDVSFLPAADSGSDSLRYAAFATLIPYDSRIVEIDLLDVDGNWLDTAYVEPYLEEIVFFEATETAEGYQLSWEVEPNGEDDEEPISFDVMAVSEKSGEKIMLAYRTEQTSLDVPYDYLEPNDTFVFRLLAYDASTRLEELSPRFTTPQGKEERAADEAWFADGEKDSEGEATEKGGGMTIVIVLCGLLVVVAFGAGFFLRGRNAK